MISVRRQLPLERLEAAMERHRGMNMLKMYSVCGKSRKGFRNFASVFCNREELWWLCFGSIPSAQTLLSTIATVGVPTLCYTNNTVFAINHSQHSVASKIQWAWSATERRFLRNQKSRNLVPAARSLSLSVETGERKSINPRALRQK